MRPPRLLYDGLWRCLCPSFDELVLSRTLNGAALARSSHPFSNRNQTISNSDSTQRRQFGTGAHYKADPPAKPQSLDAFFALAEKQLKKVNSKDDSFRLLQAETPKLDDVSRDDIIKALRFLRDGNYHKIPDPHDRIVQFVNVLILNRDYTPDAFIYECLMDVMADPKGSSSGVRKILNDMVGQGIAPTADVCYSALSALAVHPDYTLRETVLSLMSTYWYDMTMSAKQDVAIGMLRDGQHELALANFTEMHEGKEKVDLWVYDIFIIEFGRIGFLDEMLQLLRQRKHAKGTDDAFRTLLLHALDVFSGAYHEEGTTFVWEYVITHRILNPPNSVIENVLATAAHHANTSLASEALDILSKRGKVSAHQYEALVDTFATAEDIVGAFGVLAIMERSGASVQRGTTRRVYQALRKNPWLITEASDALGKMGEEQEVPLQAIGVTIEAIAKVRGTQAAMALYHDTFSLSGKRPDYDMLKHLILNCNEVETMWSLAKDYGVMVPEGELIGKDALTLYERMIPACAQMGDFDRAFEFAEKLMAPIESDAEKDEKTWRFQSWVIPLIETAVAAKDQRVWPIIDEMTKDAALESEKVQVLLRRLQIDRRAETLKKRYDDERSRAEAGVAVAGPKETE